MFGIDEFREALVETCQEWSDGVSFDPAVDRLAVFVGKRVFYLKVEGVANADDYLGLSELPVLLED